jgi:hypothetical protein
MSDVGEGGPLCRPWLTLPRQHALGMTYPRYPRAPTVPILERVTPTYALPAEPTINKLGHRRQSGYESPGLTGTLDLVPSGAM